MKLESCGWLQMKADFKGFSFVFLFFIFDHGKGVKFDFSECVFYVCLFVLVKRGNSP